MTQVAPASDRVFVVACWPDRDSHPSRYDCSTRDLHSGREIHRFETALPRAVGGLDEQGHPEIRLTRPVDIGRREQLRIGLDGTLQVIDPAGRSSLAAPAAA